MAGGERPAPKGAHNWNRESALETRRRQQGEQAREQADVIRQYRKTSVDRSSAYESRQGHRSMTYLLFRPDWNVTSRNVPIPNTP